MSHLLGTYTEADAASAREDATECVRTAVVDPKSFSFDHLQKLCAVKALQKVIRLFCISKFVFGCTFLNNFVLFILVYFDNFRLFKNSILLFRAHYMRSRILRCFYWICYSVFFDIYGTHQKCLRAAHNLCLSAESFARGKVLTDLFYVFLVWSVDAQRVGAFYLGNTEGLSLIREVESRVCAAEA